MNSKNFAGWNNKKGILPKLKGEKLSKMKTNDTETSSPSPKTIQNFSTQIKVLEKINQAL